MTERTRRHNEAVRTIIHRSRLRNGQIDLSVWDGRLVAVRTERWYQGADEILRVPAGDRLQEDVVVQQSAGLLAALHEARRAVLVVKVKDGGAMRFEVREVSEA